MELLGKAILAIIKLVDDALDGDEAAKRKLDDVLSEESPSERQRLYERAMEKRKFG